jgi:hypothetical protein
MIDEDEDGLTYLSTHGTHEQRDFPGHAPQPMIAALVVLSLLTLFVLLDTSGGCDGAR